MEQWKRYQDSNYEISESGKVRNINTGKIQKYNINSSGYYRCNLRKDKKHHYRFVHQLVYELYIGEIKEGYIIQHKDKNINNNHYSNLVLVTRSEGLKRRNQGKVIRYTSEQKIIILKDLKNNSSLSIYEKYGISHSYLARVKKNDNLWSKEKKIAGYYE